VKIILPISASVLLTCIFFLICVFKTKAGKGNKQRRRKHKTLAFKEVNAAEGLEFPVVSLKDVIAMTNNFHNSFMIGQGGFGKVYKAKLDGQEIAIKRLHRDSEQGIVEFRNEIILIARLQHRNLVRFLSCCIEGDEKLLIFEYMPNNSLDAHIFSKL